MRSSSSAWQAAQQLRDAYRRSHLAEGRTIAQQLLDSLPGCPIPEIARVETATQARTDIMYIIGEQAPARHGADPALSAAQ